MAHLTSIKLGSWKKVLHRRKGLIVRILFPHIKMGYHGTLFALEAHNSWKVHQMDVKSDFLNGDLKESVFMSQPEGFIMKG